MAFCGEVDVEERGGRRSDRVDSLGREGKRTSSALSSRARRLKRR